MQVVMRTLFSNSERTLLEQNQCFVLDSQSDTPEDQIGLDPLPDGVEVFKSTFAKSLLNGALRKSDQIDFKVESEPETQVETCEVQTQTVIEVQT